MSKPDTVYADERRFLDDRGNKGPLAPNGLNPATIMEKAVRDRIVDSYFYKEQCFALNEADIVDRVVEFVTFIGGTHGVTQKPTPFLCLAFKLLQLAPGDDVVREYLGMGGEHYKYLRALGCFYVRMTKGAKEVYEMLEPFLEDRRKLRRKGRAGVTLTFMDEFVDDLLVKERVCGTSLWKMPKREALEDAELLEPRSTSDVEAMLEEEEEEEEEGKEGNSGDEMEVDRESRSRSRSWSRSRSRSRSRNGEQSEGGRRRDSRSRSRSYSDRSRSRSYSRTPSKSRSRSHSASGSPSH